MAEKHSTKPTKAGKADKPAKPYDDFPLFPHATKRWAKKIKGKIHYFGSWADGPEKALQRFLDEREDLYAGRIPRSRRGRELSLADLCNRFLDSKNDQVKAGELKRHTWDRYEVIARHLVEFFGRNRLAADLEPEDWVRFKKHLMEVRSGAGLHSALVTVRSVFKWGFESRLLKTPMVFGPDFRVKKNGNGAVRPDSFTAAEILAMLDEGVQETKTPGQWRAMILLGVNAAFGPSDLGELPRDAVDLEKGWITFPRTKNGTPRRARLWPETLAAIREYLDHHRPEPKPGYEDRLFLHPSGQPWWESDETGLRNRIRGVFATIVKRCGIDKPKTAFYGLRRSFRTAADSCFDVSAINVVMGHQGESIGERHYLTGVSDQRLERVAETVRVWLVGGEGGAT